MGANQAKCCAPQDASALTTETAGLIETKTCHDEAMRPQRKPLWQVEAEKQEEAAKKRLQEALARMELEKTEAPSNVPVEAKAPEDESASAPVAKKRVVKGKAKPKTEERALTEQEQEIKKLIDEAIATAQNDSSKVYCDLEVKIASANHVGANSELTCFCEVLDNPKAKTFRTKAATNADNPSWNQMAKISVKHGETLRFTLHDKSETICGTVEFPFKGYCYGYDGELRLVDANADATLKVRVKMAKAYVTSE